MIHSLSIFFIFASLLSAFLGRGRMGRRENEMMEGRLKRLD